MSALLEELSKRAK
jgi:putative addiction module component (TIGR02574 family)